jgi:hypothetical protein
VAQVGRRDDPTMRDVLGNYPKQEQDPLKVHLLIYSSRPAVKADPWERVYVERGCRFLRRRRWYPVERRGYPGTICQMTWVVKVLTLLERLDFPVREQ